MNGLGIAADGARFSLGISSKRSSRSFFPGIFSGPPIAGSPFRFGEDALSAFDASLLPGGSGKGDLDSTGAVLPLWAVWRRLSADAGKRCEWETKDDQGKAVSLSDHTELLEYAVRWMNKQARKGADSASEASNCALVVDDDLDIAVQERLVRTFRLKGLGIDLLPRSVALLLAWVESLAPGEKRKLHGKKVLVAWVGVDGLLLTKAEMQYLDKDWQEMSKGADGFLIPRLKRVEDRTLHRGDWMPLDLWKAATSFFEGVAEGQAFQHSWLQVLNELREPIREEEFAPLAFGESGWVEGVRDTPDDGLLRRARQLARQLSGDETEENMASFSAWHLVEQLEEWVDEEAPERILLANGTSGLLSSEWQDMAKRKLDLLPDFMEGGAEYGAALFSERSGKLPTYLEELPDIRIRGRKDGLGKPTLHPLVDTETDYARGGQEYVKEPYDAILQPGEELAVNLAMGEDERHGPFTFTDPPAEPVRMSVKVTVKASQGYGTIELIPHDDLFRRANGEIVLDWENLEEGFKEVEGNLAWPPVSPIPPVGFLPVKTNYGSEDGYHSFKKVIREFSISLKRRDWTGAVADLKKFHPLCRNGLSLGSDVEQGIRRVVGEGLDDEVTCRRHLAAVRDGVESLEGRVSSVSNWQVLSAGSHFWADTPKWVRSKLMGILPKGNPKKQFVEAAGRAFHTKVEVQCFVKKFVSEGKRRIKLLGSSGRYGTQSTLKMWHWFKAFAFVLRTNEEVASWLGIEAIDDLCKIFAIQIRREWEEENGTRLREPFKQALLASLYLLRFREIDSDAFAPGDGGEPDQRFAQILLRHAFESWLVEPWVPRGMGSGQRRLRPKSDFYDLRLVAVFLWPEEEESYTLELLRERWKSLQLLDNEEFNEELEDLLEELEDDEMIRRDGSKYVLDGLDSYYDPFRKCNSADVLQPAIVRFLFGRAGDGDIELLDKALEETS